ncbi:MAG: hypothetical protein NTV94_07900 [Planctomycetota bacterium]|nr:hypothetical protein [Planctomycetota bacterium]
MVLPALCVLVASMAANSADSSCADHSKACSQKDCQPARMCAENCGTINGRVFTGAIIMGPSDSAKACPDAARYGAQDMAGDSIRVRVPGLFGFESCGRSFEISPWQPITSDSNGNHWSNPYKTAHRKLAGRVEAARQQWLKDNNFVGGVRTFVNDAASAKKSEPTAAKSPQANADSDKIEPRAVIELPPDMPRLKAKVRVLGPTESPARKATATTRVLPRDDQAQTQIAAAAPVKP